MDGSYNNPVARGGQTPISPATPSNAYQVNVNRSKTKKWVEAKTQNYDGDDWGADEYDDDDDDDEPVPKTEPLVPRGVPTQLPSVARAPSGPQNPHQRKSLPLTPAGSSAASTPPPLHVQTQPPPQAPVAESRPAAQVTSPFVSGPSSMPNPSEQSASEQLVSPQSSGAPSGPRIMSSTARPTAGKRAIGDANAPAGPADRAPLVRPSEIYRRMEEEKEKERTSIDSARPSVEVVGAQSSPLQSSIVQDSIAERQGLAHEDDRKRFSTSPQLPNVSRLSGFGVDMFSTTTVPEKSGTAPANTSAPIETVQEESQQDQRTPVPEYSLDKTEPDVSTAQPAAVSSQALSSAETPYTLAQEQRREMERQITPDNRAEANAPEASTARTESIPLRPSLPGGWVTETPAPEDQGNSNALHPDPTKKTPPEVSPISEQDDNTSKVLGGAAKPTRGNAGETPGLDPATAARSLPPLRTPSPHGAHPPPTVSATPAQAQNNITSPPSATSDIIAPLKPRMPEQSPSEYSPEPLDRTPTFGTVTSSPIKESDVLSDEIIRSLSPGGPSSATPQLGDRKSTLSPGARQDRESSYTLSGYDDYWADTTEKASLPTTSKAADTTPVPPLPKSVPEAVVAQPSASPPKNLAPDASATPSDGRKRFSWEMESGATPPGRVASSSKAGPGPVSVPAIVSPTIQVNDVESVQSQTSKEAPNATPSDIQHSVSKASTAPSGQDQTSMPEPPSPVSLMSDKAFVGMQDGRPSLHAEMSPTKSPNSLSHPEGHSISMVPQSPPGSTMGPSTGSPMVRVSTSTANIPSFKEIMALPTGSERIVGFKDARERFASQDTGLENWLTTIMAQHPEHNNATSVYNAAAPLGQISPGSIPVPGPGQSPTAQQPYYQQYLNASSPAPTAANPAARSRIGGIPLPSQATASAFGHSSNQIGNKSKKLMDSAGKMSKGLFSKGKSKLRGTGDKGESTPPPVQPKVKAERRASWALSLGPRSRTDEPTPQPTRDMNATDLNVSATAESTPTPTPPPQLPQLTENSRLSPFDTESHGESSQWPAPKEPADGSNGQHSWFLPETPGSEGPRKILENEKTNQSVDRTSEDWVVVPRLSADQPRTAADLSAQPAQRQPPTAAIEDSGIGMSQSVEPKRNSSFIGLPPIRRSSTFGLSKTTRATERFPLDDDVDEEENTAVGTMASEKAAIRPDPDQPLPQLDSLNKEMGLYEDDLAKQGAGSMGTSSTVYGHPSYENAAQNAQAAEPRQSGQPPIPAIPAHYVANPIQTLLPPSGPWKLEESHLSEPLHQVTRNRAGTGSSQQYFGFDKETGVSMPTASPTSPIQGPPLRPKNSDVPPSSAQRYPDLFHQRPDQQRARADSRTDQPILQQPQGFPREDIVNPRAQNEFEIQGIGPPSEDRGRQRRGSGVFKGIGDRLARATSRERRSSLASPEPRPPPTEIRPDDVSMSSVATEDLQERKKKRSSFLMGMRSRPSMDQVNQRPESSSSLHKVQSLQTPDTTPQKDRKKGLFGAVSNFSSSKLVPGTLPRASTSSLAVEQPVDTTEDPAKTSKKRFSGMAKMATLTGAFQRSGQDQGQDQGTKPSTSHSAASVPGAERSDSAMGPPDAPGFFRTRTGTGELGAVQSDMAPPKGPVAEPEGRRSRRGSAAGLLSGIMGHVPGLKKDQQQIASQGPGGQIVQQQMNPQHNGPGQHQMAQQQMVPQNQQRRVSQQQIPGQQWMGQQQMPHYQQGPGQQQAPPQHQQQRRPYQQIPGQQQVPLQHHQQPLAQEPTPGQQHVPLQQQHQPLAQHPTAGQQQMPLQQAYPQQQQQRISQQQPFQHLPAQQQMSGAHPFPFTHEQEANTPLDGHDQQGQPVNKHASQMSTSSRPSPLGQMNPMTQDSPTDPDGLFVQQQENRQQQSPATSQPSSGPGHAREPSEQTQVPLAGPADIPRPLAVSPDPSVGPDEKQAQSSGPIQQTERQRPVRVSTEERNKPLPDVDPATSPPPQIAPAKTETPPFSPIAEPSNSRFEGQDAPVSEQLPRASTGERSPPGQPVAMVSQQPGFYNDGRQPKQSPQQGYRPAFAGQQPHGQQPVVQQLAGQGPAFRQSPQVSMDLSRTGTQTSSIAGPPSQSSFAANQNAYGPKQTSTGPPGPANGPTAAPENQGSRWKGLRNRMSEQVAQIKAPSQDKAEKAEKGDKVSATKLLGAFKRNSKPAEPSPAQRPPRPGQGPQAMISGPQGQYAAPQGAPGQYNQPGVSQGPYGQQQQAAQQPVWRPPPGTQVAGQPVGMHGIQERPPYAHYQHQRSGQAISSPPQTQHQFQPMQPGQQTGQQSGQQQGVQQQQQQKPLPQQLQSQWRQSQQPTVQHQNERQQAQQVPQQQRVQRAPEPQYDQVPIPKGYSAVHGEGQATPSPYNVGRHASAGQFYPTQQYQQFSQQQQIPQQQFQQQSPPLQQQSPPLQQQQVPQLSQPKRHVSSFMHGMQQQQVTPPPGDRRVSDGPALRNQASLTSSPPVTDVSSAQIRPDAERGLSDVSYNSGISGNNVGQIVVSPEPRQDTFPRTQPDMVQQHSGEASLNSRTATPDTRSHVAPTSNVTNGGSLVSKAVESSRDSSLNRRPTPEVKESLGQRRGTSLGVDVEKAKEDTEEDIYDVTPRVVDDEPKRPRGPSEVSKMTTGGSGHTEAAAGPAAELEDTAEEHKRKRRLESQEEKIFFDPADDPDHQAQMSATSYPGQEWNPYGEFEYGDWKEE